MGNGKIVLDADNGRIDKAAEKTKKKYKEIGKAATGVGDEMGKWGKQAATTLVGIGAVLQIIGKVGQELKRQRQEAITSSKTIGEGALGRSNAMRKIGLTKMFGGAEQAENAVAAQGGGNQADIDSLLNQAADSKQKVSPQNVMSGVRLLNTGLFSISEVTAAMSSKSQLKRLEDETIERGKSLTAQGATELSTRSQENAERNRTAGRNFKEGIAARATDIVRSVHDSENPITGFLMNTAEEAPLLGSFFGKIRDFGSTPQASEIVQAINAQTRTLLPSPKPNLNTDAGVN